MTTTRYLWLYFPETAENYLHDGKQTEFLPMDQKQRHKEIEQYLKQEKASYNEYMKQPKYWCIN